MTAAPVEYLSVLLHLRDVREEEDTRGTIYQVGTFEEWIVAVTQTGFDKMSVDTVVAGAIAHLSPEVLLVVGIAFGVSDIVRTGDVFIASSVVSITKGYSKPRISPPIRATHRLLQRAQFEAMTSRWLSRRDDPTAPPLKTTTQFGTLATVMTGDAGNSLAGITACDTQAYWVLSALHETPLVDALVVKGIANTAPGDFQEKIAAQNASAFTFEVLAQLPRIPSRTATRGSLTPSHLDVSYLKSLVITKIRALIECRWEISAAGGPGWHVMLGDNGTGKSTLLRSVALAMFDTREMEGLRLSWASWLHFEAQEGKISVTLAGTGGTSERTVILVRESMNDGHKVDLVEGVSRNAPATVFSAGYGPFRRFSGGDLEYEKEIDAHPRLLRHMSLFSERVALTESLAWLRDLRFKQLEGDPSGELLTEVRSFINGSDLLPAGVRLTEVSSDAVTFVDGNDASVPIEELSDGFRSVLSLTLDLIRHMALAYGAGNLFSPVDPFRVVVAGIVLIDEIDVHLHPSWQHRIGDWFRTHFPAVQFIVATHSPIICQGADTVFLLPQPGTDARGRHLTGIELERVRNGNVLEAYGTGVFGHGVTRSEQSKLLLKRLTELNAKELDEELSEEEQAEQADLRAILPTNATSTGTGSQS